MKLSIVIVNYNTRELLVDCINSIEKSPIGVPYEIIVVDNNSYDKSTDMLKKDYPHVKLIANQENAGFARANNQGFELSVGEYILLLNSDTIILDVALKILIDFMDMHKEAAICGPKLLNSDLTIQLPCRRGFPRFINSISHFTGLAKLLPKSKVFASYLLTYLDSECDHEVDAVSGACMLVRRDVVDKIGGLLDEAFFMHFEDIDLCYRAKQHNYKVFYVHDSQVIHLKGQSSKLRSEGVTRNFFDSALIYFKKNYKNENLIGYILIKLAVILFKQAVITITKVKSFVRR